MFGGSQDGLPNALAASNELVPRLIAILFGTTYSLAEDKALFVGILMLLAGRMFAQSDDVECHDLNTTVTSPDSSFRSAFTERRFIVTMAVCAVIYLPSLAWTLGLDQNIFAEIASLILKGQRLYVDAWDVKPPNIFYTYAFFQWLFGQSEFAVRLSDYVFALLACAALFVGIDKRVRVAGLRLMAPFAAVLFVLTLLSLGSADTAQTETFSLVFIIAAAVLAFQRQTIWLILAGSLIGSATFYKTTNAVFVLPIAIEILFVRKKTAIRPIALILLGMVLWSAVQIVILSWQGSLSAYLTITANVFSHHADEISDFRLTHVWRILWVYADVWLILSIAAIVCALFTSKGSALRALRLPLLYLATGLAIVWLQNKGWGYHYVIMIPGLIACCAIAIGMVFGNVINRIPKVVAIPIASMLLVAFFGKSLWRAMPKHDAKLAYYALSDRPRYLAHFGRQHSLYYPPQTEALAHYLQLNSARADRIFIFGDEPGAYWRANRSPASKYTYTLLFNSGVIPDTEIRAMSDSLTVLNPQLIAVERFDTTGFRGRPETSESVLQTDARFESVRQLLTMNYAVADTVSDNFIIYRRR